MRRREQEKCKGYRGKKWSQDNSLLLESSEARWLDANIVPTRRLARG